MLSERQHKITASLLTAAVTFVGLSALVELSSLNQLAAFGRIAWFVYAVLVFKILFFYDLHYRRRNVLAEARAVERRFHRVLAHATRARLAHLVSWRALELSGNYLLLPTFLYWAAVGTIFLYQGRAGIQQGAALLVTAAMTYLYWNVREILSRKLERVDHELFVGMSTLKVLTAGLAYAASLAVLRRYCVGAELFAAGSFAVTFLLVWQALFQHNSLRRTTVLAAVAIGALQGLLSYFVYRSWGQNAFTAGVFLTAVFHGSWSLLHHQIDRTLTRRAVIEIILVVLLAMAMVFSVTNFKAQLGGSCFTL